jgi:hypothetical protein
MNTNYLAALGAGPPLLFVSNEQSYSDFLYVQEILNHTHTILGSITLIQVIQPDARESFTIEAVPGFSPPYLLTVLDSAHDAGL